MAILRNILAEFAVRVDDKPLTRLDKRIDKVKANISAFATQAATVFAAAGFATYKFIDAASHAQETTAALNLTFKQSTDDVINWSRTVDKQLGLSQFTLQESALRFGAFLQPIFRDADQDIGAMSKKLTELAADLAAFYDTSNDESLMRLFSGLSGETEAVRRLGIDISDQGLNEFNKKRGDPRQMRQLTLAEKSLLRYEKILADTAEKQGTAAREAQQWAGSLKRLGQSFKTFSVLLGQKIIKPATNFLHVLEGMFNKISDLLLNTKTLETAFLALAAGGLFKATRGFISYRKEIWAAIVAGYKAITMTQLLSGALAALTFVFVEDLLVAMDNGRSTLGDFLRIILNTTKPGVYLSALFDQVAVSLHNGVQYSKELLKNMWTLATFGKAGELLGLNSGYQWNPNTMQTKVERDTQNLESRSRTAAEAGNFQSFQDAHKNLDVSDAELQSRWDKYRKSALLRGAKPREEDVGSGYLPMSSLPAIQAANAKKGPSTVNVAVNMAGLKVNATTEELTEHMRTQMEPMLREAMAAVGEESG